MSEFSEMDIEMQYDGDPFASDDDFPDFSEQDAKPQEPNPPADAADSPQEPEPLPSPDTIKTPDDGKGAADDMDEAAKRKAHEEAEARRKAEWEAKQQKKKAAMQEQLDRLAAMSDDEVMTSSMKRVGADTEKLTRRNMKDCVSEYIQTLCLEDPAFARRVMDPRKGMVNCFRYINRKAWDYIQDELKANGIQPGRGQEMYGCDVPDDLCYQWAVDYYNDPDAKEDKVEEEKFVPKPYIGKSAASRSKGKPKTKKDAAPKKAEVEKPAPKKAADADQLTFGSYMMPEEKAR